MVDPYVGPDPKGAAEALAHHLRLPMFSLGGGADSKVGRRSGRRGGRGARSSPTRSPPARSPTTADTLNRGWPGSLGQLAICDELVGWTRAATAPVDLSDEALALDLVDELGVDGSFLEADHTLRRFRIRWYPDLLDRRTVGGWAAPAAASRSPSARPTGSMRSSPATRSPPPLPDAATDELREIVARAEARAGL